MAVDNLPFELPRYACERFGDQFLTHVILATLIRTVMKLLNELESTEMES